jgi:hypothetical protein
MIIFVSCFTMGRAHRSETFPNYRSGLSYCLVLGPLFWECPPPRVFTLQLGSEFPHMNTWPSSHAATGRRISHGCQVLTCYVKVWKSRRFSIQEWFCQSKWLNWKKPANGYSKESSSTHFEWPASLYKCKMWSYLVCSCWIVVVVHGNWWLCVLENTQYRP